MGLKCVLLEGSIDTSWENLIPSYFPSREASSCHPTEAQRESECSEKLEFKRDRHPARKPLGPWAVRALKPTGALG